MTIRIRRLLKGCLLLVLFFGMIGANGQCDLAMQIWADLQQQLDDKQEQIDSQQQQIDQLTGAVCGLSVLTGNSTHPEFCEVVVTETCECGGVLGDVCACDPGPYFELKRCESGGFPHPDSGEVPPLCEIVDGCRGTFTRIASGDVGSIKVEPICVPEKQNGDNGGPGHSGEPDCPSTCVEGCPEGSSICNDECDTTPESCL